MLLHNWPNAWERLPDQNLFSSCFKTYSEIFSVASFLTTGYAITAAISQCPIERFHPFVLKLSRKHNIARKSSFISLRYLRLFWLPLAFHFHICYQWCLISLYHQCHDTFIPCVAELRRLEDNFLKIVVTQACGMQGFRIDNARYWVYLIREFTDQKHR